LEVKDGQEALLDRGGHPTLRELLRQLVFSPGSGTIRLNKERLILQRANHTSRLRDQLIERYGRDEAFVTLTKLGFAAGLDDADFVRQSWPSLDPGDLFTAGTRLHMLCGCVRLKTVHNDFDLRKGRFSGEFLWHESAEAVEYCRNHGRSPEAVCWSQVGYASGYATRCFGKLIIYKELECLGTGRDNCRVLGKPAEAWGANDDLVQLYRREIAPDGTTSAPNANLANAKDDDGDPVSMVLLAPIREQLERIARFDVPLLITGEPGTGKRTAARAWSEARFGADGTLDIVACDTLDPESLDALFDRAIVPTRGRRPRHSQTRIVLTDIDLLAPPLQRRLAGRLDQGDTRIAATTSRSVSELYARTEFEKRLLHRLAVTSLAMPPLRSRRGDIPKLAKSLMGRFARQHGLKEPTFLPEAETALGSLEWLGNVTELNALVAGALIAAGAGAKIGADLILALVAPFVSGDRGTTVSDSIASNVLTSLASKAVSLNALNGQIYRDALERCDGNVAAAARMLGVSRAQLAYRLRQLQRGSHHAPTLT
jgi:DNA-binding NtrC family response regulator